MSRAFLLQITYQNPIHSGLLFEEKQKEVRYSDDFRKGILLTSHLPTLA